MKKSQIRGLIILGVVLIAYLVLALVIPFKHTGTYWLGFAFGIIGIIVSAVGTIIAFKNGESAKSKFYGFPIARLAVFYAVVQIIVSFILMGLANFCPSWVGIIVCVILLVLTVIGFVATDAMRDEIERQDIQLKTDVKNMRNLQSLALSMVSMCNEAELKKIVQGVADEFKYSDPVSSEETKELEAELEIQLKDLQGAILDNDAESVKTLCGTVVASLTERNRVCRLSK